MGLKNYIFKHITNFFNRIEVSESQTSVIALFYNKKLLILQRGDTAPWMPNKWSLVGGSVDEGEDTMWTVIREAKEEIGLGGFNNIQFIKKIQTTDIGEIHYFIAELDNDNVVLNYENKDYRFISIDEIGNYNFVPYVKDFIKNIHLWNPRKYWENKNKTK